MIASEDFKVWRISETGTLNPNHQSASSVVDACGAEDVAAFRELVSFGFIRDFDKGCSSCGAALGEAEKYKADDKLHFKCTSWEYQNRHNGVDLCRVITFYSRSRLMEARRVANAQSQLKLERTAVEHIYEPLQAAEARAGEVMCFYQD